MGEWQLVCAQCGTDNESGRKFCMECAAPLAASCPACGTTNPPAAKFCGECANPLTAAPSAVTAVGASQAAPTSTPVAERRLVSVLFADLVGFTPFAEERDAEEVRETLSAYFDLAREVMARYGGTVEKFIGDAVMAVWGAPTAHEDDAERAVRAALELVEAVPAIGAGISARAAVLTGEAAVTVGATDQGMVAGDLVNTAARLQSVAPPGAVLVGESTQRATNRAIAFEPAGEHSLKGKDAPLAAYRALRVVAEVGGRNRADTLEAPFVGRTEELRLLKELFHTTGRERRPRLVSVVGPAGIGKSRFGWEFAKYIDGLVDDIWWHAGRAPAYGEGVTFWALGEMVRERAGLAEGDDEPTTRARIAETVARWVPDQEEAHWIEASLLALLGIETERASTERLFAAWRTFFERICAHGTVVLLFEDLQWADAGLLDFIDHLLDWSRDVPLFVLTLARPELLERRPEWASRPRRFSSIILEPLAPADMRTLLAGLVPGLPGPAVATIVERAEGMPLYAVETVRMLVAEGRLERTAEGTFRPLDDLTRLDVPQSLTALIAARLDALTPAERALTADAAVLGQSFSAAALAAVAGVEEAELEPRLRTLVRRELLTELRDPRSPERGQYAFVQALIREVAYQTIGRRERRGRHLGAARYFEALGSDELASVLAGHYLAAHQYSSAGAEAAAVAVQARIALRAAAERASELAAHAQAASLYEQAVAVTEDPAEQAHLVQRAGEAASNAGRHDEAERLLRDAVRRTEELGDRIARASAINGLGRALLTAIRTGEARRLLLSTVADYPHVDEHPEVVKLWTRLAVAHMSAGEDEEAVEVADRVLAVADPRGLVETVAEALMIRGAALTELGRRYEGIGAMQAALALSEQEGLRTVALRTKNNMAAILSFAEPRQALAVAKDAARDARELGMVAWSLGAAINGAEAAYWTGDWDWTEQQIAGVLDLGLDPTDGLFLRSYLIPVRAARGLDPALETNEVEPLLGSGDADAIGSIHLVSALAAIGAGDAQSTRVHARQSAERSRLNSASAYPLAARAAIWMHEPRLAQDDLAGLEQTHARGTLISLHERAIKAGIAALDGRTEEALTLYQDVLQRADEEGLPVLTAYTAIDMAMVLDPSLPDVQLAAARAREVLTGLRAQRLLEVLDGALTRPIGAAGSAEGSAVAAEVASDGS